MANVEFLTGVKSKIDEELSIGIIDEGDIILTSDTDEIIFINPNLEKRVIKSKTQKSHTLNGTSLGALEDGDVIEEGVSIDDLLEIITKKYIPVEYEAPTIFLSEMSNENNTNFIFEEVGNPISLHLKSVFNQNDAGSLISHYILKNNEEKVYEEKAESIEVIIDNLIAEEKIQIFTSKAEYQAGEIKNDNLGNPNMEDSIKEGFILSDNIECIGQRCLFYGTQVGDNLELNSKNIRALEYKILNPIEEMTFSIPVNIGQQYIIFAYPSYLKDVEKITYLEMSDNLTLNFDKNLVNVNGANDYSAIEYKVYLYKMAVPAAAPMTFKITI